MNYQERCTRCGCTRLDHGLADGSGRCKNCGKKCNAFNGGASKSKSGKRRRQRRGKK